MSRSGKKRKTENKKLLIIAAVVFGLALIGFIAYYYLVYAPYVIDYDSSPGLCKTIRVSDENGINLVFFSNEEDAKKYSDYLFSVKPLMDVKNNFNVYYVDNYIPKCDLYRGVAILCYSRELLRKAAACPNDYIVVLEENEDGIRSSSYLNVMSINTLHPLSVMVHEFGHSFANLAEEYTPAKIPRGSKNCQSTCEGFDSETDGCFLECSEGDYFRSIENGVMRTLQNSRFGIFNERLVIDSFNEQYSKSEDGGILTGRAIGEISGDLSDECLDKFYYEVVRDSKTGEVIGKSKRIGCGPKTFEPVVDPGLVFTDGWKSENTGETKASNVDEESVSGENPNEEIHEITGETYLASEIGLVVVQQIPEEVVDSAEGKTVDLTVLTKEVSEEVNPQTGETEEVVNDVPIIEAVDFSDVPEPEPEIVKKKSIFSESAKAIKSAIDSVDLAPTGNLDGGKGGFKFIKNNTNSTSGNETNYTLGELNITEINNSESNTTNGTGKFFGIKDGSITGEVIRELNTEKRYWIVLLVAFVLLVAYLHIKRKH